jgi:hypothetical protein
MVDRNLQGGEHDAGRAEGPASSVSDVLDHLTQMTYSLERAWSEGLNTQAAEVARREAKEVWSAFGVALEGRLQWVQQLDETDDDFSLGVLAEGFPLDNDALSRLRLDPSGPVERYRQLQSALMYAIHDLKDALKGLDDPSGKSFDLLSGRTTETWWEAGAFVFIRRRAAALSRILRAQEECLKELTETRKDFPGVPSRSVAAVPAWAEALAMAGGLVNQGWHEAALPLLLRSLKLLLADAVGVEAGELPVPLAASLRRVTQFAGLPDHLALLEEAAERVGSGFAVDYGVAVPLAKELHVRIQLLARNLPPRQVLRPLLDDRDG